jgi:hypothetical protein
MSETFLVIAAIAVIVLDIVAYVLIKAYAKNKEQEDADGEELT